LFFVHIAWLFVLGVELIFFSSLEQPIALVVFCNAQEQSISARIGGAMVLGCLVISYCVIRLRFIFIVEYIFFIKLIYVLFQKGNLSVLFYIHFFGNDFC